MLHHSYNSPVSVINRGNLTFFYARMVFLGNGKKVFGGFEIKKTHRVSEKERGKEKETRHSKLCGFYIYTFFYIKIYLFLSHFFGEWKKYIYI